MLFKTIRDAHGNCFSLCVFAIVGSIVAALSSDSDFVNACTGSERFPVFCPCFLCGG
jgi:hypothetical protein